MPDLTERTARSVQRHFVTLSCVQFPPAQEPKLLLFSGFVIDVRGEWFYVTAGHIARDIRNALASGSRFDVWRLGDCISGSKFKNTAVPYDVELERWLVLSDDDTGLDYAAVHLQELFRRQLEAGGVEPIGKNAWADHLGEFDQWALVGVPSESVDYDGKTNVSARFVMAPLVEADAPAEAAGKAMNQFYALLADGSEDFVHDVDGMSGGPIVAVKRSGTTLKYWVIGVQSGWYKSQRLIAACPFSSFASALEELVAEAQAEYERRAQGSAT
jgi:hypothetical protein